MAAAVYAVIYLVSGYDVVHAMHRTPPDDSGAGNNPEWRGFTAGFSVPLEDIHVQVDLLFSLICRSAGADYSVGDVRVPVGELLIRLASDPSTGVDPPWSSEFSYPVKTPWGWRRGTLSFRVRCGETLLAPSAAAGGSLEWVATGVPAAAVTSTLPLAYEEAYLPDDSKFYWRRRRNGDKLFALLLAMVASWLLLLVLLYVLLVQVYLAGSPLRPPLPVILVYGYLERPAMPPPAAPAAGGRPRWPAILLLGGLLTIIRLSCCT